MNRQPAAAIFAAALLLAGASRTAVAAAGRPFRRPARRAQGRDRGAGPHPGQRRCATAIAIRSRRSPSSASSPSDTVVEIWPGGGWYTEILAPYLRRGGGTLLGGPTGRTAISGMRRMMDARSGALRRYRDSPSSPPVAARRSRVPDGSADVVLTFRNVHNWQMGYQRNAQPYAEEAFRQMFRMLQARRHAGRRRSPPARKAPTPTRERTSGYVKVSTVRRLAEAAGFRFVAASEINANPRDTADWPQGVWTLPPTYASATRTATAIAAIGESDRMTLRFVKPAVSRPPTLSARRWKSGASWRLARRVSTRRPTR